MWRSRLGALLAISLVGSLPAEAEPEPSFSPTGDFSHVRQEEVMRVLFPKWDPKTQQTNAAPDEFAELQDARTWTEHGVEHLAVLTLRWSGDASSINTQAFTGFCDLSLMTKKGTTLGVEATAANAGRCGGAAASRLDLAKYDIDSTTRLIGVRQTHMNHGLGDTVLRLFKPGKSLEQVFEATLEKSDRNKGTKSPSGIIEMESNPGGVANIRVDFRDSKKKVVSSTRYTWNGTQFAQQASK